MFSLKSWNWPLIGVTGGVNNPYYWSHDDRLFLLAKRVNPNIINSNQFSLACFVFLFEVFGAYRDFVSFFYTFSVWNIVKCWGKWYNWSNNCYVFCYWINKLCYCKKIGISFMRKYRTPRPLESNITKQTHHDRLKCFGVISDPWGLVPKISWVKTNKAY